MYLLTCGAVADENLSCCVCGEMWLRFTSCALSLECLLSVLVECGVSSTGSGPEMGKGRVGFCGRQRRVGGRVA